MRIRAADYRAMAWKNGQGMTREIAREPGDGDFLWRLSIAEVAASGDFSLFPGYDRTITLIEGAGMRLAFEEAPEKAILKRFEPFDFSGDWHCRCSLVAGPVRDFNLMVDRGRAQGRDRSSCASTEARSSDASSPAGSWSIAPRARSRPAGSRPRPATRSVSNRDRMRSPAARRSPSSCPFTCSAADDAPRRRPPASIAPRPETPRGCRRS